MRKQGSMLPMPRGSRVDSFAVSHSASSAFSKFGSKYIGGSVGKQEGQGLWQDILRSFMNGLEGKDTESLHGTLFVLGRASGGKSELISELKNMAEKGREREVGGGGAEASSLTESRPYIGLDFSSIRIRQDLLQQDQEDSIEDSEQNELAKDSGPLAKSATLDVWSVDHCGLSEELVKRLVDVFNSQGGSPSGSSASENVGLNVVQVVDFGSAGVTTGTGGLEEDSRDSVVSVQSPNIMFLIVLDSSLPWTLNDDLVTWIQQIQECWSRSLELSSSSPDIQRVMIQDVNHYFETRAGEMESKLDTNEKSAVSPQDGDNGEESTPRLDETGAGAGASYPKVNLGIPIGVVLTKSDIGHRFSVPTDGVTGQPFIPFALSFLMNVGDPYGISYFMTSIQTSGDIHQSSGVDLLLRYILHRLFDTSFTDEDGSVLKTVDHVVYRNNSISCVLPRTSLHRLSLTPVPDVKSEIYEELVPRSKFTSGAADSGDTSELVHGLSTAFDKKIPSLNDFLEQIRPQIPLIEQLASPGVVPLLSPSATSSPEEAKSVSDSASTKGAGAASSSTSGGGVSSGSSSSQRLRPSKSTLNSNNPGASGDPSLKGFFQSLIQRGEKKGSLSHRSNLKPAASMNLRKEFSSRIDSKLSSEATKLDEKPQENDANPTEVEPAEAPAPPTSQLDEAEKSPKDNKQIITE